MIESKTFDQIKQTSIEERISIIEPILQSLKKDIRPELEGKSKFKPFKIREFSLGKEIHVERDKLYSERGL
ncbi:MAG: hypothetical protein ACE5PV_09020 [Candidatus Poribacteria bacterium]